MGGNSNGEPFGTTPLPTSGKVSFDWEALGDVAQQPQSQQIAVYEATPNEECINGSLLDVNQHFVVYAVKNGLIRVLHRHSALRSLLRGHQGQSVTDIQFFQEGDVLATAGHSETGSKIIIWRVYEQSPDIRGDILLEIPSTSIQMDRIIWHPFNPNQFLMVHSTQGHAVSTLVETTRLQTSPHPETGHAVVQFHSPTSIMEGAVQLSCASSSLTDVCWSGRDSRHVLSVHNGGEIILWDLKQHDANSSEAPPGVTRPKLLTKITTGDPQSRCFFLPHENTVDCQSQTDNLTTCFGTASRMNTVVTIWSAFTASIAPTKLQTISLEHPSPSYVIDICFGPAPQDASPPSCFLLMGDRHAGKLLAFHVLSVWSDTPQKKALLQGCDYVVPFQHKHPIYSWSVVCSPTTDISEEDLQEQAGLIFDMKLFSYQAKVVQCLTVTSFMCLPPEHSYSDPVHGVRHEPFSTAKTLSDGIASEDNFDEDYDIDEEEEPVEDEYRAPDAASLPAPTGIAGNTSNNPFANWLGAIAGKPAGAVPLPSQPVVQEASGVSVSQSTSTTSTPTSQSFLSPIDLLKGQQDSQPESKDSKPTQKGKKGRSKSPKAKKNNKQDTNMPATGKIQILKREDNLPPLPPQPDPAIIPAPIPGELSTGGGTLSSNIDMERIIANALAANQEQQQAALAGQVQLAVAEEMNKLLPMLSKMVQDTVSSTIRPLANSVDQLSKKGVQVNKQQFAEAVEKSIEEPLKTTMANTTKNVFIPAFESITAQVLQQVTESSPKSTSADGAKLDALTAQMAAMSGTMQLVMKSIEELKQSSSTSRPAVSAQANQVPPPPQQSQMDSIRNEVNTLLAQNQYEAAFTKALSAGTPDMTVYCCSRTNVADVLGGSKPALSQPILLCLMQQLGATLLTSQTSNLQMEVSWLQELALTLNPTDPSIQRHAPTVLQQIVTSINQRMTNGDPQLRRPLHMLLQVIRGMQMG